MAKSKRPTKCISVRLMSFFKISDKAYKACAFDGSTSIIPAVAYYGEDKETTTSRAYWIAKWAIKDDELQHKSHNPKVAFFDEERKKCSPPVRGPRRTTFTVTYKKSGEDKIYVCKTIADNEDSAKLNMQKKFRSGELEFNHTNGELEIISIETRPGRK